jgi:polysaccharide deacetylase family protein (PEP-CTERM system associated)
MNILTFDIEEWFHLLDHPSTRSESEWLGFPSRIEDGVDRILGLLSEEKTQATFFCLGWIAEKFPHLIKKISDNGYEIACHSHMHQLAFNQTPTQFREDLRRAKYAIEDVVGKGVNTYRIPGFSLSEKNLWAFRILHEEGFSIDCSVFPASRSHGGLKNFTTDQPCLIELIDSVLIKELPLNTRHILGNRLVFSGGGYFRLMPYFMLKKWFASSDYVMTYFHPRDFDPLQPVIPDLSMLRRFKSYYGLDKSEKKLQKLLSSFAFTDVKTAVESIDWNSVRRIKLNV